MITTYVFPGQGSQFKGMGGNLFDEFKDVIQKADNILGYSIKQLCLEDSEGKLHLTQYTQPALYVVNALMYYKKIEKINRKPDFLAGHSLGEYNAIHAAGGFDFETGLKLVKKRGELMGQVKGGGMAAVIGLTEDEIIETLANNGLENIDIANLNTSTQIVISGNKEEIHRAKFFFEKKDALYIPLNVSAAFHSRFMQDAKKKFEEYLKEYNFSKFTIPVISNLTGKPYAYDDIAFNLVNQLRSSVRWTDSISYLIKLGEMNFEEIGPGNVLTKLINKIKIDVLSTQSNNSSKKEEGVIEMKHNVKESKYTHSEDSARYKHRIETAYQKVLDWNRLYPVGTRIKSREYKEELKTRTKAVVLFGHKAVLYVENYNGYFELDEITIVH